MEKQLSYVLMLSLEQMALRRIAVAFYSEPHMLALTAKFQFRRNMCYRHTAFKVHFCYEIEWRRAIKYKLSKLQLPKSLKNQMMPILQAVGSEICEWKFIHEAYLSDSSVEFKVHILEKLCWTTAGAVDHRKTAEGLVRCDVVDIVTRFELACLYCLENYISLLWEELPEEYKKSFYNEEVTSRVETPHLQLFLPYILKKQSSFLPLPVTSPRNSFEESALYGNKTLAEYFFWKLTKEERKASLVRAAYYVIKFRYYRFSSNCEVLCYLLSLMTLEEQMRIFKKLPCEVLRCFLAWPWQDLFLNVADVIWTFLPDSGYKDLVDTISWCFRSGYYLPNFFQNLFLRSPNEFRKRFADGECQRGYLLREFLMKNDAETIKVIFRNIDAADRVRLVSSKQGLDVIYQFTHNKWHVVEVFLREATLSKEDKGRLKEAFIEFTMGCVRLVKYPMELVRRDYRNFFEFVEEPDASAENKRSSEDETLAKTKKLCCEKEENSTE